MVSDDLHYYGPKAVRKTEHPLWMHGNPKLLNALVAFLHEFHNGQYPEYRFRVEGIRIYVQIWLGGQAKEFTPGEYQPEFDRILGHCRGFEAGWTARERS